MNRSVLLCVAACAALFAACAHLGDPASPGLSSIDTRTPDGGKGNLAWAVGKVTVIDVCAAWSDPCLVNAKAVDEACRTVCGDDVVMVSMLLDDLGPEAVRGYKRRLEVSQRVVLPGPRVREGESALGDVSGIPRLVIFDREGRVVQDLQGAMISPVGLIGRVKDLL